MNCIEYYKSKIRMSWDFEDFQTKIDSIDFMIEFSKCYGGIKGLNLKDAYNKLSKIESRERHLAGIQNYNISKEFFMRKIYILKYYLENCDTELQKIEGFKIFANLN